METNHLDEPSQDLDHLSERDSEALAMGRTIQRMINRKIVECFATATEELVQRIREIIAEGAVAPPPTDRYLDSAEIARRLGLSRATAERLCRRGDIDAVKTKGNQWRTTPERLRKSRYVCGERRRRGMKPA